MQKNINLVGYVDDIQSLITASTMSIVPLLVGGGTRLKILEAMALRTPVVSTTKGAEGLSVRHEENILIADTPGMFAEAVIRLLQKPELRQSVAENAYRLVSEHYNWPIVIPRFVDLAEKVAQINGS